MSETFTRQWAMLKMIPRHPRTIDSVTIRNRLRDEGVGETNLRTIQRDLEMLSQSFPLAMVDPDKRPIQWHWTKGAAPLDIPALSPDEAMAMKFVETYLQPLLPRAMLNTLAPHFETANRTIKSEGGKALARWTRRVRVLPKGVQLLQPTIDPVVQTAVYEALLRGAQLAVTYRARGANNESNYSVSPLGIVVRDGVVYVVVAMSPHNSPFQLVLHRIKSAVVRDEMVLEPPEFDLDHYIARGEFAWPSGKKILLEAIFSSGAAKTLSETPLSVDQEIKNMADGRAKISATVLDTGELKWWLMSFGAEVEVTFPKYLRKTIAAMVKDTLANYLR